ncbi:MAG: 50S ribosomal protein L18 [Phycisphaeraceae bacterium]|nr:50S ribosomal protein L18 [Phycisphaeraceae bacterium]
MAGSISIHRRMRRKKGIRRRISGTPGRPRLSVFRSLKHIYAQVIDDLAGRTLASASSRDAELPGKSGGNIDAAKAIGKTLAERAKQAGVSAVVFDRNGYRYHGRVKALADGAREGGLQF